MEFLLYDILYFLKNAVCGAIICAFVASIVYMIYCYKQWIRMIERNRVFRVIVFSLFSAYLYIVIGITLLSREPGTKRIVKWILFSTFGANNYAMKYVIENILLFIPLGIFHRVLWDKCLTFRFRIQIAAISSVIIELLQYSTKRGRFEVDDIMLNTLGAVIGWLLVRGITYIARFFLQNKSK